MVIYTYSCLQPHTLITGPVCCILVGSSPYRQFILWQDPCANRKASQLTEGTAQQERRLFFAFHLLTTFWTWSLTSLKIRKGQEKGKEGRRKGGGREEGREGRIREEKGGERKEKELKKETETATWKVSSFILGVLAWTLPLAISWTIPRGYILSPLWCGEKAGEARGRHGSPTRPEEWTLVLLRRTGRDLWDGVCSQIPEIGYRLRIKPCFLRGTSARVGFVQLEFDLLHSKLESLECAGW